VDVMRRTKLVWFRFGEKEIEVLDELEKKLDLESRAEVLRIAINLLNFTNERFNKGYQLVFTTKEEGEEEFVLTKKQKEEQGLVIKITSIEDVKDLPTSDN
jgi:hypothetical protein